MTGTTPHRRQPSSAPASAPTHPSARRPDSPGDATSPVEPEVFASRVAVGRIPSNEDIHSRSGGCRTMTGDLGALGFWLFLGMLLAAGTVTEGLKARDKERERQATLRALLDKDEKTVTEVLAYLREKDAAELKFQRQMSGLEWRWSPGTRAVAMGILAFVGVIATGFFAGAALQFGFLRDSKSAIPVIAMFGIWAAAPIVAWRVWRSRKPRHDAPPDA